MANHHDVLVKEAFSSLEDAAAEFKAILPERLVQALDLKKLTLVPGSFRDKKLAESHTDILYSVPLRARSALVYVLFEHKSDADRWTTLQLLGYMLNIWERFRKDNPNSTLLPPIIPLVLHHSRAGWSRSTSFNSLFDPELLAIPGVTEGLPNFHFHLDDISHISEADLRARAFSAFSTLALASLSRSRAGSEDAFLQALAPLADLFAQLLSAADGPRALRILFEYISRVAPGVSPQDLERYLAAKSPEVQDLAMTIAEQIKQEGLVQGRVEGRVEGQALSVLKQLKLKFGPVPSTTESAILAASPERLDLYLERILTAQSIDDVIKS
ncbi:MAG: Rpn family recombination-promoting nuclease/putative transposase [Polyangiaceae bacterium]|nr:Rpn family recombination-promoting nuclease/putative transposase [Polyangiaceae bacterium]